MADDRGYGRRLPAGVVDSGFASLATFIVGLSAVNLLDDVNRGVYAVYFTAFLAGTMLPRQLIFTPAEVKAVSFDTDGRLAMVPESIRLAIGPALVGSLASVIAWLVTLSYASTEVSVALLVTCGAAIVLSPIQDHVRKMLHIATMSWRAVSVSLVQFVAVGLAVTGAIAVDVPIAWIPFGALTVANVVSLTFARVMSQRSADQHLSEPLSFRELANQGVWLVLNAGAPAVAGFAIASIVVALASPEALGYAESARVVAQPVLVLAAGLTAVLSPRSMRAAIDVDLAKARHTSRAYLTIMAIGGLGYFAVAGWDWALNPMTYLVPSAYVVSGLVAVAVVANVMRSATFLQGSELLGARGERRLALIAWIVAPVAIGVSFTAGVTGAFARPLSVIASAGTRYVLQARGLHTVYRAEGTGGAGRASSAD